jgi:hypothetical protein
MLKWKNVWGMEVQVGDRLLVRYPREVEVLSATPGKTAAGGTYLDVALTGGASERIWGHFIYRVGRQDQGGAQ